MITHPSAAVAPPGPMLSIGVASAGGADAPAAGSLADPVLRRVAAVLGSLAVAGWMVALGTVHLAGVIARTATYGGALVAVGVSLFVLIAHDGAGTAAEQHRLYRILLCGATVAVAGSFAQVGVQAAALAGDGWIGAFDRAALDAVLGRGTHLGAAVRLVGVVELAYAATRRGEGDAMGTVRLLTGTGIIITLASFLIAGHTATREPAVIADAVDLAHTGTASLWTGGLVGLAVVLAARRDADPDGAAAVVARFSRLMVVVLTLLLASAGVLAWMELGGPAGLTSSDYGAVLSLKSAAVVLLLAIGAHNHRHLVPAVAAGGWSALRRTVHAELALLVLVIALTGLLTGMDPA